MLQRHMLMQAMSKNITAPGKGLVIMVCLLSIVVGIGLAVLVISNKWYEATVEAYRIAFNYFKPEDFFKLLADGGSSCLKLMVGALLFPLISAFVFGGFNLLAMLLACCGATCCGVFQGLNALFYGGLALYFMGGSCGPLDYVFDYQGKNYSPTNCWIFYAILSILSILSVLSNIRWCNSKTRAEQERNKLSLMVAMSA